MSSKVTLLAQMPRRAFFSSPSSASPHLLCLARLPTLAHWPGPAARMAPLINAAVQPYNPSEYIQTAMTGNRVSRKAVVLGSQNIILGGKCIIHSGAILRGDLRRLTSKSAEAASAREGGGSTSQTSNSVVIGMGRYCTLGEGCLIRPAYKTYRGCVRAGEYSRPLLISSFPPQHLFLLHASDRGPRPHWRRHHRRGRADWQPRRRGQGVRAGKVHHHQGLRPHPRRLHCRTRHCHGLRHRLGWLPR